MHKHDNTPDTIPYGFCHCGCGEKTTVAAKTDRRAGQVRGEPIRYRVGHNFKITPKVYTDGDTKKCSQCSEVKLATLFYTDMSAYDGHKPYCIACAKKSAKKYRQRNREKIKAQIARWRRNNAEHIREYNREYVRLNADRVMANKRIHRVKYAKRAAEMHKKWVKRNPESNRIRCQNRRARLLRGDGFVSKKDWEQVLAKFNGQCAKCGSTDDIHMDHVVPLSKGGRHAPDNIQPLCATCNLSKYTKIEDYRGRLYIPAALPLLD